MQTKTNFAGKKFEYTDTGSGMFKSGTTNSTIEFTSDGENGQVAATYSLDWKYSGDTSKGSSGQYYLPVNLSGNLTGAIEHEFGKDNFSIELNDAENQVTFTGGESYATISAGDGESNTMSLCWIWFLFLMPNIATYLAQSISKAPSKPQRTA